MVLGMVHLNPSSFILHCQKQVIEYDKWMIHEDKYSDTINKLMLEYYIDGLAELRSVKTTAAQL